VHSSSQRGCHGKVDGKKKVMRKKRRDNFFFFVEKIFISNLNAASRERRGLNTKEGYTKWDYTYADN
jgi:hypothetical protein